MRHLIQIFIAGIIVITVFGTAILGFRTMIHESDHMATDCVATVLGTRCGDGLLPLMDTASHIGKVKTFTLAILFAVVAVVVWMVVWRVSVEDLIGKGPPRFTFEVPSSSHPLFLRRRRWLALREKRDPSVLFRVQG